MVDMIDKSEFIGKIKGPISQKELERVSNLPLFPKEKDLKLDVWMISEIQEKPLFFRFYHKFADKIYGVSVKIGPDCDRKITGNCVTFVDLSRRIAVNEIPGEVADAALLSLKYKRGKLKISSSPLNSRIIVDGVDTLKLTPQILDMIAGEHVVRLEKTDFVPAEFKVDIIEDRIIERHEVLPFG